MPLSALNLMVLPVKSRTVGPLPVAVKLLSSWYESPLFLIEAPEINSDTS
jgi:hypothetical protein